MSKANDVEHIPQTGAMDFARWSATSGFQFCSCGNWHQYTIEPKQDEAAAKGAQP
jgi:hypothetical protein